MTAWRDCADIPAGLRFEQVNVFVGGEDGFHTYRFVVGKKTHIGAKALGVDTTVFDTLPEHVAAIFIDKSKVAFLYWYAGIGSADRALAGDKNTVFFGDRTDYAGSHTQLKYFAYTNSVKLPAWPAIAKARRAARVSRAGKTTRQRHFVKLVVARDQITFQGGNTTWRLLPSLLAKIPDREHTVLELAMASDQATLKEKNDAFGRAIVLADQLGFEYASYVGIPHWGQRDRRRSPSRSRIQATCLAGSGTSARAN